MSALPATSEKIWREQDGRGVYVFKYFELPKKATDKTFTVEEVRKHNKRGDCWIMVEGKVYDVSNYLPSHPGGSSPILAMGGRDCTDAFGNYHPSRVYEQLLPFYYIGTVKDYQETPFEKGHRAIRQQLLAEGRFQTRASFYVAHFSWLLFLIVTAVCLTVFGTNTWLRLLGGATLALFWQQMAFIGHDGGHNAISHNQKIDSRAGILIGNISMGISMWWWKWTHNVHHVACNSVDIDPDIHHMPFIAVCIGIFDWYRNTLKPGPYADAAARFLISYQHYLFYPIMLILGRYNLYAQSWRWLLTWPEKIQYRKLEMVGLIVFLAWFTSLLRSLPSGERIPYLLISHGLAGFLHIQIVLSHFAMPTYRGQAYNGDSDEWFKMQLMTSQNIITPRIFDWVHGGLQFQIEHHLWPRLPRHELRYASKLVREYAAKHDIPYNKAGWFAANVELIKTLYSVAQDAKKLGPEGSKVDLANSMLWDGLNARG